MTKSAWMMLSILLVSLLPGCGVDSNTQSDARRLVYLVDRDGQPQELQAEVWYLIAANGLQQALPTEGETQCRRALSQLHDAVCRQGKDLKQFATN